MDLVVSSYFLVANIVSNFLPISRFWKDILNVLLPLVAKSQELVRLFICLLQRTEVEGVLVCFDLHDFQSVHFIFNLWFKRASLESIELDSLVSSFIGWAVHAHCFWLNFGRVLTDEFELGFHIVSLLCEEAPDHLHFKKCEPLVLRHTFLIILLLPAIDTKIFGFHFIFIVVVSRSLACKLRLGCKALTDQVWHVWDLRLGVRVIDLFDLLLRSCRGQSPVRSFFLHRNWQGEAKTVFILVFSNQLFWPLPGESSPTHVKLGPASMVWSLILPRLVGGKMRHRTVTVVWSVVGRHLIGMSEWFCVWWSILRNNLTVGTSWILLHVESIGDVEGGVLLVNILRIYTSNQWQSWWRVLVEVCLISIFVISCKGRRHHFPNKFAVFICVH